MQDKLKGIGSIHFIGVGGISLSALAKLMHKLGKKVTGSDLRFGPSILDLMEEGITVWVGSEPKSIGAPDLAVYSSAIPDSDKELSYCCETGILTMERFDFLKLVSDCFKTVIAIGGTHGKTTTTAMLAYIMREAGLAFCAHIGGDVAGMGNLYYGGTDYFLTEACEYKKSLLHLNPQLAVVLNAESDHPDTFATIEDVYDTFREFLFANGRLSIVNADTEFFKKVKDCRPFTFGEGDYASFKISDVYEYKPGYYSFFLSYLGMPLSDIKLFVPGRHNVLNAAAAAAAAFMLHIEPAVIAKGIAEFAGVKRRFEKKGKLKGADIYIDYAHHPSEIKAALALARRITQGKLFAVFQPHTYSRTLRLMDEFSNSFTSCDEVLIVKEYGAREKMVEGGDALTLSKNVKHKKVSYYQETLSLAKYLARTVSKNDTVLILGAGDIDSLADILV